MSSSDLNGDTAKTRSFRIKESKPSKNISREQSQSGVADGRRASHSNSEISEKTKKGVKSSAKSAASVELTDREQALHNETKKLDPLISKYMEVSKWNSDKERLRAVVGEKLKEVSPLFSAFSLDFIDYLLMHGSFSYFSKEQLLFSEGDRNDKMGILMHGIVQFNCKKGLVTLIHGGLIGEECVFRSDPVLMSTTIALSKTCVLWLPGNSIHELRNFCDQTKKKNEYILFNAHLQKHMKLKS